MHLYNSQLINNINGELEDFNSESLNPGSIYMINGFWVNWV